jgi:hypothetical protein
VQRTVMLLSHCMTELDTKRTPSVSLDLISRFFFLAASLQCSYQYEPTWCRGRHTGRQTSFSSTTMPCHVEETNQCETETAVRARDTDGALGHATNENGCKSDSIPDTLAPQRR